MKKNFLIAALLFASLLQAQVKNVKHVILIGVDGLGAYAFPKSDAPTMKMMMNNGALLSIRSLSLTWPLHIYPAILY